MTSLFDQIARTRRGPSGHAEGTFTFLNSSAWRECEAVRRTLEDWFGRMPLSAAADVRGRFRSSDEHNHRSAFFELVLHEVLVNVVGPPSVHADAPSSTKRPDFLCSTPRDGDVWVEAVSVLGASEQRAGADKRLHAVYDAIDCLDSPDFFLSVSGQAGVASLPVGELKSFLRERLKGLDPEDPVFADGYVRTRRRTWDYHFGDWDLEFTPIPKHRDLRGRPGVRPIGIQFEGAEWRDDRTPLRDKLDEKASAYRDLGKPYIIAVDAVSAFADSHEIVDALFGSLVYVYDVGKQQSKFVRQERKPDGFWWGPGGPRNKRVSGVLCFVRLSPFGLGSVKPLLFLNPWAERAYEGALCRFTTLRAKGNQLSEQTGSMLHEVLSIPKTFIGGDSLLDDCEMRTRDQLVNGTTLEASAG